MEIRKKKIAKRALPIFLDEIEQNELLKQPNPRYITGLRNLVLIEFMLDTGLRVSEVTNLKWDQINFKLGDFLIKEGKGNKDRYAYISSDVIGQLEKWRERQRKDIGLTDFVFTTCKGGKLLVRYIQQMIKRYSVKAGIKKKISPHKLRHTFATEYYRHSKDILRTSKLLGHNDIATTMIYTHIVDEDLAYSQREFQKYKHNRRK